MKKNNIIKVAVTAIVCGAVFGLIGYAISGEILAFCIVFAIAALISALLVNFSESRFAKMKQDVVMHLNGKTLIYNEKADLYSGKNMGRGILALSKDTLYFVLDDTKSSKLTTLLEIPYKDILSLKLHFVIFVEGPDHRVYEIKTRNNLVAYNLLCEKCKI